MLSTARGWKQAVKVTTGIIVNREVNIQQTTHRTMSLGNDADHILCNCIFPGVYYRAVQIGESKWKWKTRQAHPGECVYS